MLLLPVDGRPAFALLHNQEKECNAFISICPHFNQRVYGTS
jgi:hypothetical protein